jgi:ribosome recycling factor
MTTSDPRLSAFSAACDVTVKHLQGEFAKLQTGRANAALVEHVDVEAYGQHQPLKNLAGISLGDSKTIVIQPWDKSIFSNIERALQQSNVGATPMNDGTVIRLSLPSMTEERRGNLKKVVSTLAEEARISVRKHRQEAQDSIKAEKDEDVKETLLEQLQKATDSANEAIAATAKSKEEELMKI